MSPSLDPEMSANLHSDVREVLRSKINSRRVSKGIIVFNLQDYLAQLSLVPLYKINIYDLIYLSWKTFLNVIGSVL